MQLKQKMGGFYFKLGGMLLLTVILSLCSIPVVEAVEEKLPAAAEPQTAPCKGLKPYNNLDELLYQFYINLDSECLFEMKVEDLEKAWGVKILNDDNLSNGDYSRTDFIDKPYRTEKMLFILYWGMAAKKRASTLILK